MLFNSLQFLIFFPVVVCVYFLIPNRIKYLWLLAASYYFYMCWNIKYVLLLLASTVVTYFSGLLMDKARSSDISEDKKVLRLKLIVAGSFIINLGILGYFKYFNFFIDIFNRIFTKIGISLNIPGFDILLPVGISFYTFQALSYTMDVYRGEIYAEKNFFRYALFVSFFPQLVAGPIERSKNLLKQLAIPKPFDYDRAREGLLLMIWGYFLKLVMADRIALFVDTIYADPTGYPGWYIAVAAMLFAVQIYCDFYGYSTIAMGAARVIGIDRMENFNAPFLATTIPDLWKGWHISLTSWFRDYLYFPLGGSRKGRLRKCINIMIIFVVSGLWHGAELSFVVWGAINGIYQLISEYSMPYRIKLAGKLGLHRDTIAHRIVACLITFWLFDFSVIFFRAQTTSDALALIKSMLSENNIWILVDGSLYQCGLDSHNFTLMLICILILLVADICKKRGIRISKAILTQDLWCRILIMVFSICFILVFGVWGSGYSSKGFIYFQF